MATITQTKLVGFGYGNKSNYNATTYANHIWFDPTNKQILLNGIEYIPKKLSELVNDSGFLTSANFKIENTATTAVKKITMGGVSGNFYSFDQGVNGNYVLAGATSSNSNTGATFRKLVEADIPALSIGKITNLQSTLDTKLSSITKAMVENVLTGNITSHYHNSYLLLSGGTMTGKLLISASGGGTQFEINNTNGGECYFYMQSNGTRKGAFTTNHTNYGTSIYDATSSKYLGIKADGTPHYQGNTLLHSGNYTSYAATKDHTHTFASITSKPTTLSGYGITDAALATDLGKYLPLTGGTLSGDLTCNGSFITMSGGSGAKGYKGYFNQSGTSTRGSYSNIFGASGYALGNYAVSLGANAYAGIRNQDDDKGTYPYIAWQWMPSVKVNFTINNQDTANGAFYGYEVLGGKMVQYEIGGIKYTYENTSTYVRVLVCVKDDEDTGLIFGGKSYLPFNATKTLISGKYILGRGESITNVNTITVGDVNYYMLAIYTWSPTVGYDYSTRVKVMCATKVNNSNYNGASSYASGNYSVASGAYSVASGHYSVASGYYSVASGYYSVASGAYSVASGASSVASGNSPVASGYYSVASGYYSVASGAYSVASGHYSVASGHSSVASGNYSVAMNYRTIASSAYQLVIGRRNAAVSAPFVIGNGSGDDTSEANATRSNCFVVDWYGNVTAKYFSGYANAVGSEGIKVYATNSNEINFGGTSSSDKIFFGYRSLDSRPTPTAYNFGNGTATLEAASFTGNATTATALTSSAGSATQPVYFSSGKPVACTYSLGKSVPSNAVFTDTTYSVATASANGLMSTAMFKEYMVKSVSVRQGPASLIEGGSITDHNVYITQKKNNITNAYVTAIGDGDVKIPNATTTYDGSMSYTDKAKLNKMPSTVFGCNITFTNATTCVINTTFGDYNIKGVDASIGSVDTTQRSSHYITVVLLDITNSTLISIFQNGFIKFSYSSKGVATYQVMRLLQSNFYNSVLFIEYIHTEALYNVTFDCIWEIYH